MFWQASVEQLLANLKRSCRVGENRVFGLTDSFSAQIVRKRAEPGVNSDYGKALVAAHTERDLPVPVARSCNPLSIRISHAKCCCIEARAIARYGHGRTPTCRRAPHLSTGAGVSHRRRIYHPARFLPGQWRAGTVAGVVHHVRAPRPIQRRNAGEMDRKRPAIPS